MFTLDSMVSKCQTCQFVADAWDIICKVDSSHTMGQKFQWLDAESMKYSYSDSPLSVA